LFSLPQSGKIDGNVFVVIEFQYFVLSTIALSYMLQVHAFSRSGGVKKVELNRFSCTLSPVDLRPVKNRHAYRSFHSLFGGWGLNAATKIRRCL
ncbi:MAG: hypothetical protein AAFR45_10695, partial [Pseudomonadota bacterium]